MLRSRRAVIIFVIAVLLVAVGLAVGAGAWLLWRLQHRPYRAMSESMSPTIHAGDLIVADSDAYRNQPPARGDIVLCPLPPPARPGTLSPKRVVALGGDTVRIADGKLYVNGEPVEEPYIAEPMRYQIEELTVPPGHVYVLGDNRNDSNDSHLFGPVAVDGIEAKVVEIQPAAR